MKRASNILIGAILIALIAPVVAQSEIKIVDPKQGSEVTFSINVDGTISGALPNGQYMWILIGHRLRTFRTFFLIDYLFCT